MREPTQSSALLGGRVLLSLIFLASGAMKVMHWSATADSMAAKGMPAVPFMLGAAIVVEIVGGLAVLLGCQTRMGALALFLFLIPTTLVFHNFWTVEGQEMQNQMQHFLKNITIMGGLLTLVAAGAGRYSVDAHLRPAMADRLETRGDAGRLAGY